MTPNMVKKLRLHVNAVLNSYSELFFIQGLRSGLLILGVCFLNPSGAIASIIALVSAYSFARLIGFNQVFLNSGFYTYNPILVGLSIGFHFKLTLITILLIIVAGILTFVITVVLAQVMYQQMGIKILSLPFVIVSSLVYLAIGQFSGLVVQGLQPTPHETLINLPIWMIGFFSSLGAIIFMPSVTAGMLLFIMMILSSRIMPIMAIMGFFVGATIMGLFTGSMNQAFLDVNNFNYILIAIALGSVFLIPSIKSYMIACIGVGLSTCLVGASKVFWATYGIPMFTLPFNIVTLSFTYLLGIVNYADRPIIFKETPEKTLDHFLTTKKRFNYTGIAIHLPFTEKWQVWQGFDGQWTHKGPWKHGYDFIQVDCNGSSFNNKGQKLSDYYCFNQPVTSPVKGQVVQVINHLPDNPIGSVDTVNNWGNMVLIYDARGIYIELSHFAQESIAVVAGDWVEVGTVLGRCGNSGYSPQPHVHIHVQETAIMGSPTIPFTFFNYIQNSVITTQGLPVENQSVAPCLFDLYYDQITTFMLDDLLVFSVQDNGVDQPDLHLTVKMDVDGSFFFQSDSAKLYFGKQNETFYCYHMSGVDPYLAVIFKALPKMPLSYNSNAQWTDYFPDDVGLFGWKRTGMQLIKAIMPSVGMTQGHYRFNSENSIVGTLTAPLKDESESVEVLLDPLVKFKSIQCENIILTHKESKT